MKHYRYKNKIFQFLIEILQFTNFQGVNIDSDNFIYTLFTAITSVCMCKVFLIHIKLIIYSNSKL